MSRARRALRPAFSARLTRVLLPGLAAAAVIATSTAVASSHEQTLRAEPATVASQVKATSDPAAARQADQVSRDATRPDVTGQAKAKPSKRSALADVTAAKRGAAAGSMYATTALRVRSMPNTESSSITVLDDNAKVAVTRSTEDGWRQVVVKGKTGWVKASYLTRSKPKASSKSSGGSDSSGSSASSASGSSASANSSGACASGSSVESGLTANAIKVHRAVCHAFPQIMSFGGVRADSLPAHPSGRAVDNMIPNWSSSSGNALGWKVANYVRAHASELGVTEVIYDQKIWTTQRGGEGWRSMSSRGGATANHQDHVHVTVR